MESTTCAHRHCEYRNSIPVSRHSQCLTGKAQMIREPKGIAEDTLTSEVGSVH